jgi:5'-nucleotidase
MQRRPFILITNDDGVYAPGIKHLCQAVQAMADVVVVAPAAEQSAVSLSITIRHPLRIEKIEWPIEAEVWSVNGTPADCVKLALNVILPRLPDLVLSGINRGTNAGRNILYSGTVAAIIESTLHEIPGVAFSLADFHDPSFTKLESFIPPIVEYVLKYSLPKGTFLNVNFPPCLNQDIQGIRMTSQGREYWIENPEQRNHPAEGHAYYWLGIKLAQFKEADNSDVVWLRKGYATATPISINDLTDRSFLAQQETEFDFFMTNELSSNVSQRHQDDVKLAPDIFQ